MNNNWLQNAIEVTKYDPKFRNEDGHYLKDEWTDYSCIGKIYSGKETQLFEYLEVEEKYIKAAQFFFNHINCREVVIKNLEKYTTVQDLLERDSYLEPYFISLKNNSKVTLDNLTFGIQLVLRNYLWFNIFCATNTKYSIRFGRDYYMYFVGDLNVFDNTFKDKIKSIGLFIGR